MLDFYLLTASSLILVVGMAISLVCFKKVVEKDCNIDAFYNLLFWSLIVITANLLMFHFGGRIE